MTLTDAQKEKFRRAIIGTEWPDFTDDPLVNYEIDRLVDKSLPDWDDLPDDEKRIYYTEVGATPP